MSRNRLWNPTNKPDKAGVTRDKTNRSNMSGLGLWNPAKKSDKAGVTQDKAERPDISGLGLWNPDKPERLDISGLGAKHIRPEPLETGLGAGYVWPDTRFLW
jgi:hypothetical protein